MSINNTLEYCTIEYYKNGDLVAINQAHPDIVHALVDPMVAKGYTVKVYNETGTAMYILIPNPTT